jgi:hypothetical protein
MTAAADVARFPPRASFAVWLSKTADGWLVLARGHGWLHGDAAGAFLDARWLSRNLGLPIRVRS